MDEKAYVVSCNDENYQLEIGKEVLSVDPHYFRPTEVDLLIGDPTKAIEKLGWVPKYNLSMLVKDMMNYDINGFQKMIFNLNISKRHIAKTISWRIVGTIDTLLLSLLIIGDFFSGFKISAIEVVTKMVLICMNVFGLNLLLMIVQSVIFIKHSAGVF